MSCLSIPCFPIYPVKQLFSCQEPPQILHADLNDPVMGIGQVEPSGYMGCNYNVLYPPHPVIRRKRLRIRHIQSRSS